MKWPTMDEFAQMVADKALDEVEFNGKTIREWTEIILATASEDTISRQAVLDIAFKYCPDDDGVCSEAGSDLRNMLDEIENLPPAEPRTGKWINIVDGIEYTWGTCDSCGARIPMPYKYYEYCPHCGMKNEVEHEGN